MRIKNITFIIFSLFIFNGCYSKGPSYEYFKENRDIHLFKTVIPDRFHNKREVYSEDKYIYKLEHPKGCHFGYLTNRDGKPEVVREWIILSGEEFCKDTRSWTLSF